MRVLISQLHFAHDSFKLSPMRFFIAIFFLICTAVPVHAYAAQETRESGFARIWESVHRSAKDIGETPFSDVLESHPNFLEITYAKGRGLLEDIEFFRPRDPLTKADAALWLFRTRNVTDLHDMEVADLSSLLNRYPIVPTEDLQEFILEIELGDLIFQFDRILKEEVHEVSYYADYFHGAGTAFGEKFDMHAITAAHRTFPYNTLVRVTNFDNGKSVTVRINDRGPYVDGRSMDLSLAAMEVIADRSQGVLRNVRLERLGDKDIVNGNGFEQVVMCPNQPVRKRYQNRITREVRFHRGVPHILVLGESFTLGSTKPFVIRSVTLPNGRIDRLEQWIYHDNERFTFQPTERGEYRFKIGTAFGNSREMRMYVKGCED